MPYDNFYIDKEDVLQFEESENEFEEQEKKQLKLDTKLYSSVKALRNYQGNYTDIYDKISLLLDSGAKADAIIDSESPCALLEFSSTRNTQLYKKLLETVDTSKLLTIRDSYGNSLWDIAVLWGRWGNMDALLSKGFLPVITHNLLDRMICNFKLNGEIIAAREFLKAFEFLIKIPGFQPNSNNLITLIQYSGTMGLWPIDNALPILLKRLTSTDLLEVFSSQEIQQLEATYAENRPNNSYEQTGLNMSKRHFKEVMACIAKHLNSSLFNLTFLELANQHEETIREKLNTLPLTVKECMLTSLRSTMLAGNITNYLSGNPLKLKHLEQYLVENIEQEKILSRKNKTSHALSKWGHFESGVLEEELAAPDIARTWHAIL